MTLRVFALLVASLLSSFLTIRANADPTPHGMIDLSNAVILRGPDRNPKVGAADWLRNELESRAGLTWPVIDDPKDSQGRPVVAVGTRHEGVAWTGPFAERLADGGASKVAEGYRIDSDAGRPAVVVLGNDERGARFGVGRLLRELRLSPNKALLPRSFRETSAPKSRLRGHQLGYRAKTNSYDAWDRAQWQRYIRDLAIFGANAIELLPPRTDDDLDSPHFPLPPLEMMTHMSSVADSFDMDVWVWFPVMDAVDSDPSKIEPLLKEWDQAFRAMPRLDAVFVPGGDPGHIAPTPLFAFLEKARVTLGKSHPKAKMWVSPQGFDSKRMVEFMELIKAEPSWLDGIVYGPQVRTFLPELRKTIPARYPIRGYPDITHSRQCQHPVPDWDLAYAVTEGREAINPRPRAQAALVKAYAKDTIGSITYSEGCNDDVNKAVWSALMWDPDADVVEVLRQYARVYLGEQAPDRFAQALLALERNWSGPLLTNAAVETTLRQFQDMERDASPALLSNWRFQQGLYRAYYDAYIRDRLIQETALEQQAWDVLGTAPRLGADLAMTRAEQILDQWVTQPVSLDRRARVFELGEALFQSVRMQLSKPKYRAIDPERGANLDTIDTALNNRDWLKARFALNRTRFPRERDALKAIEQLRNRADPGPGGFYDDLGDPENSLHLVREPTPSDDPLFAKAPFHGFELRTDWPVACRRYIQTFYDAPIRMRYEGLDRLARYKIRVTYSGDSPKARMRLEADGQIIHDLLVKPRPVGPVEFPIPHQATADGALTLEWNQEPGRGGNGRGCEVAEVWLIRVGPIAD